MYKRTSFTKVINQNKKICWYDGFCRRTDENHFRRFAHPKMSVSQNLSFFNLFHYNFQPFHANQYINQIKEITVVEDFEIQNGVLGLHRDIYLSLVQFLDSSIVRKF
jgi:hypothetical protein